MASDREYRTIVSPSRTAAIGPPAAPLARHGPPSAARGSRKASIGEQRDGFRQFRHPLDRRRHGQHLAHARSAARTFVADHEYFVRVDLAVSTAAKQSSSLSNTRAVPARRMRSCPATLTTHLRAQGCPSGSPFRPLPSADAPTCESLPGSAFRPRQPPLRPASCRLRSCVMQLAALNSRFASTRSRPPPDSPSRRICRPGQVADQRRLLADAIEVVHGQRQAQSHARSRSGAAPRWSSRPSATAAIAFSSASRVMILDGVSLPDQIHDHSSGLRLASALSAAIAGTPVSPIGEMPRNSPAIAIVFAVNWPPQAPGPGHAAASSASSCRP